MNLNDDELREQLERRRTAVPLSPAERTQLVDTVHARTRSRPSAWFGRLAIPAAAAVTVIVVLIVVVIGFPRAPNTASGSPTPGSTPTAGSEPSPTASLSPSESPPSGPVVLSADQLAALAANPSAAGQVVVSDAVINFVPSPTQFDVPDASPQAMGTIDTSTGPIVVMGQSFVDTSWPNHAFQILGAGRVLYLGPVNNRIEGGIWTVPDAMGHGHRNEPSNTLWPVQGWLLQTVAAPCAAPPDFSAPQDYWCGGSWLLPGEPSAPTGTIQLQYPFGMHVQWSAYQDFAENPQGSGDLGGEPRLGLYLVRPAGCPPNVMGDCPVWEMVGRLGNAAVEPVPSTNPTETPTPAGTPEPTIAPTSSPTSLVLYPDYPYVTGGFEPIVVEHDDQVAVSVEQRVLPQVAEWLQSADGNVYPSVTAAFRCRSAQTCQVLAFGWVEPQSQSDAGVDVWTFDFDLPDGNQTRLVDCQCHGLTSSFIDELKAVIASDPTASSRVASWLGYFQYGSWYPDKPGQLSLTYIEPTGFLDGGATANAGWKSLTVFVDAGTRAVIDYATDQGNL